MKHHLLVFAAIVLLCGGMAEALDDSTAARAPMLRTCGNPPVDPGWANVVGRVLRLDWGDVASKDSIRIDIVTDQQDTVRLSAVLVKHPDALRMRAQEWERQQTIFKLAPGDSVVAGGYVSQRVNGRVSALRAENVALRHRRPSNLVPHPPSAAGPQR